MMVYARSYACTPEVHLSICSLFQNIIVQDAQEDKRHQQAPGSLCGAGQHNWYQEGGAGVVSHDLLNILHLRNSGVQATGGQEALCLHQ